VSEHRTSAQQLFDLKEQYRSEAKRLTAESADWQRRYREEQRELLHWKHACEEKYHLRAELQAVCHVDGNAEPDEQVRQAVAYVEGITALAKELAEIAVDARDHYDMCVDDLETVSRWNELLARPAVRALLATERTATAPPGDPCFNCLSYKQSCETEKCEQYAHMTGGASIARDGNETGRGRGESERVMYSLRNPAHTLAPDEIEIPGRKGREMNGLKHIQQIREYCDYLEEHLLNVGIAWKILQHKCRDMDFIIDDWKFVTIDQWIHEHDVSKMSAEEFIPYQQQFFPVGDTPARDNPVFAAAWEHHKQCNPHHWETWTQETGLAQELHCVCMVVDWMAMGMKFGDTAEEYYRNNAEKIPLPDWAVRFCEEIFAHLRKDG
jgi:Family of unknown function (DUF5662)